METRPSSEYRGGGGGGRREATGERRKETQPEDEELRMAEGPAGRRRESGIPVADSRKFCVVLYE